MTQEHCWLKLKASSGWLHLHIMDRKSITDHFKALYSQKKYFRSRRQTAVAHESHIFSVCVNACVHPSIQTVLYMIHQWSTQSPSQRGPSITGTLKQLFSLLRLHLSSIHQWERDQPGVHTIIKAFCARFMRAASPRDFDISHNAEHPLGTLGSLL